MAITIARADELPDLIAKASYPLDRQWLQEEQTAIGHPMTFRIRHVQLENELRQGLANIAEPLRRAIDAAKSYVITAAGGHDAVRSFPFARRHLEELAMHRTMPTRASTAGRLVFIRSAWMAIDAAMASLSEIRYEAQQHGITPIPRIRPPFA